MKTRAMLAVLGCVVLATAGDVSGKWTGTMSLDGGQEAPSYLVLKQSQDVVTGTAGPSAEKQIKLSTGKIENQRVILEMRPGAALLRLELQPEGEGLSGDVFEDDRRIGSISLKRASD